MHICKLIKYYVGDKSINDKKIITIALNFEFSVKYKQKKKKVFTTATLEVLYDSHH